MLYFFPPNLGGGPPYFDLGQCISGGFVKPSSYKFVAASTVCTAQWSQAMRVPKSPVWIFSSVLLLAGAPGDWVAEAKAQVAPRGNSAAAEGATQNPDNELCLGCHGDDEFAVSIGDGRIRRLHIDPEKFAQSVHGIRSCVECHKDIVEVQHRPNVDRKVGCVRCHRSKWEAAQKADKVREFARLGDVVRQIESYMESIHAQPSIADQSRTNASCYDCHNAHYIKGLGDDADPCRADAAGAGPDRLLGTPGVRVRAGADVSGGEEGQRKIWGRPCRDSGDALVRWSTQISHEVPNETFYIERCPGVAADRLRRGTRDDCSVTGHWRGQIPRN